MYKNCLTCNKQFYVSPSRLKDGRGKFCSKICHNLSMTHLVAKKCLLCGKEFTTTQSNSDRGGGKYCSPECSQKSKMVNFPQKCITCGKEFRADGNAKKLGYGKYCSHKCAPSWSKGKHNYKLMGENNNAWKGGITPINRAIRASLEYKLWRDSVFEKDNYRCVECGVKRGWHKDIKKRIILHADHIKPFYAYPELRFDINNGRSLCVECHRQTETWGINLR